MVFIRMTQQMKEKHPNDYWSTNWGVAIFDLSTEIGNMWSFVYNSLTQAGWR